MYHLPNRLRLDTTQPTREQLWAQLSPDSSATHRYRTKMSLTEMITEEKVSSTKHFRYAEAKAYADANITTYFHPFPGLNFTETY